MLTLVRLLIPYLGRPVSDALVKDIADGTYSSVMSARKAFEALARVLYEQSLADAVPGAQPVPIPNLRPYDLSAWTASVAKSLEDVEGPLSVADVRPVLIGADVQARNAEREHTVAYSIDDPNAVGWARYDPVPGTCSWCLMLISRGPVYKSSTKAGNTEKWHRGCTCEAVLVFDRDTWRGRDQYVASLDLWKSTTKGKSGKAAMQAFTKEVDRKRKAASNQVSNTAEAVISGIEPGANTNG